MYQRKSRLTARQRNRLVEHFVAGTTARAAAELRSVHRHTAAAFHTRLRMIIAAELTKTKSVTLLPIIQQMIVPDRIVYTNHLLSYNALDASRFHHVRINHSTTFGQGPNHINSIENFWNQAKRHLRRFNGIRKETFPLYLKECEWRFNEDTHKQLLTQLKSWMRFHTSTASL